MKVKSKIATDIKSLVLAKAKIYARNKPESKAAAADDDSEDDSKNVQKVSEAEKERKREKMRLKKQKKKEARTKSLKKDTDEAKNAAINYLHEWNSSRESWSFKKKQQCWLLKNLFNTDNISDSDFEILLNYIMDLKGAAKSRLIEECEKVVKLQEEKLENSTGDNEASSTTFERARSVLQILF
ncbi:uncharacterized protein C7orf50 homolog [Argiope bruennichi]|uniref:WKF domain-containing protein n=1 Tax=Argiope bruennichi TaxID=94029 RepID=A0A8T0FS58_ARGBR|nr:uncharacterized protein C7orf50 homolog [Argiope bruennichi]XP_055929165.1 uncharacterized protein C7orf50 homolog [Argiope bruennichi]KAF8793646.1 hypothetical protein HNY73_001697 [Argiope bruennichi]